MAKKKVYAVRRGKQTGLFYSWEECKSLVDGYPGAEFKSFPTEEVASAYLGMDTSGQKFQPSAEGQSVSQSSAEGQPASQSLVEGQPASQSLAEGQRTDQASGRRSSAAFALENYRPKDPKRLIAYVDGSFDGKLGRYSFGCVLILWDGRIYRESGNGDNPQSKALHNVSGEMLGAMYAVRWAIVNGFTSIDIRYDYAGIEQWATHGWRAKTELTQKYAAYMDRCRARIDLIFTKVAAHTGDRYNEEADQLAKAALTEADGIPEVFRIGD